MDFELDQKFIDTHKAAGKKLPFNVEGHRKAILEEKKLDNKLKLIRKNH